MAQLPESIHAGAAGTFKVVVGVALVVFMGLTLLSTAASAAASAMGGTPEEHGAATAAGDGRRCRGRDKREDAADATRREERHRRRSGDDALCLTAVDTGSVFPQNASRPSLKLSSRKPLSPLTSETEAESDKPSDHIPPEGSQPTDSSPPSQFEDTSDEEDISKPTICREVEREVAGIKRRSAIHDRDVENKIREETIEEIKLVQETKREIKRLQEWHRRSGERSPFMDFSSAVSVTGVIRPSNENVSRTGSLDRKSFASRSPFADANPRKRNLYKTLPRPPKKHQSSRIRALEGDLREELEAIAQKAKEEEGTMLETEGEAEMAENTKESMDMRGKKLSGDDQKSDQGKSMNASKKSVGRRKIAYSLPGALKREGQRTTNFDAWTRSKELTSWKAPDFSKRKVESKDDLPDTTTVILGGPMRRHTSSHEQDDKTDVPLAESALDQSETPKSIGQAELTFHVGKAYNQTSNTKTEIKHKTVFLSEDETEVESADQDESETDDEKSTERPTYEPQNVKRTESEKFPSVKRGSHKDVMEKCVSSDVFCGKDLGETREMFDISDPETKTQSKSSKDVVSRPSLSRKSILSRISLKLLEDGGPFTSQKDDRPGLLSCELSPVTENTLTETMPDKGYKPVAEVENPLFISKKVKSSRRGRSEMLKAVLGEKSGEEPRERTSNASVENVCVYEAVVQGKKTDELEGTPLFGPPLAQSIAKSWRDILKDSTEDLLNAGNQVLEVKKIVSDWKSSGSRLVDTERDDSDKESGSLTRLHRNKSEKDATTQKLEQDEMKEMRAVGDEELEKTVGDCNEGGDYKEGDKESVSQRAVKAEEEKLEGETGERGEEGDSVRPGSLREVTEFVHKRESETRDKDVKPCEEPEKAEMKETDKDKKEICQQSKEKLRKEAENSCDKDAITKNIAEDLGIAGRDKDEGGLNKSEDKERKEFHRNKDDLEGFKAKLDDSKRVIETRRDLPETATQEHKEARIEDQSEDYCTNLPCVSPHRKSTMSSVRSALGATEGIQESPEGGMSRQKVSRSVDRSIGGDSSSRTVDSHFAGRKPLRYGDLTSDISGDLTVDWSEPRTVDRSGDRSDNENYDSSTERRPVARSGPRLSSEPSGEASTDVFGDSSMEPHSRRSTDHSAFTSREVSQDNLRGASRSTNRSRASNKSREMRVPHSPDCGPPPRDSAKVRAARAVAMRAAQAKAAAESRMAARAAAAAARAESAKKEALAGAKGRPWQSPTVSGRRAGLGVGLRAGAGVAANNVRMLRAASGPGQAASPALNVRKEGLRRPLHTKVYRKMGEGHRSKDNQPRNAPPPEPLEELKRADVKKSSLLELVAAAHSHAKAAMSRATAEAAAK